MREYLLSKIEAFLSEQGISASAFGDAIGNRNFVFKLRDGTANPTYSTMQKADDFIESFEPTLKQSNNTDLLLKDSAR